MAKSQEWPYYVYEITKDGKTQYVGKGSARRLAVQIRNFGLDGHEVARFKREKDAYAFEVIHIAEVQPPLNRHPGGNGSRAKVRRVREDKYTKEINRLGSRRYAAMLLMRFARHLIEPSKLEVIRQVAHG